MGGGRHQRMVGGQQNGWSASRRGSNSEIQNFYTETKMEIQRQKRTPQADLYGTTSASESGLRRTPLQTG